jgi:cell division protein FtsB|tara:strand:- start:46 stop:222 length:177 start_codon:yes stop_codon:yes gene_type:complete
MVDDRGNLDLTKKIDSLKAEILRLEKELDLTRENAQTDLMIKDNEIGRLMKKITEKGI